MFSRLGKKF